MSAVFWFTHVRNSYGRQAVQMNSARKVTFRIGQSLTSMRDSGMRGSNYMSQVLSKALTRAERENATVYLQRVPNFSDLPEIQPYILVKSLPLADVDASGETLFQTVIPDTRYCPCCLCDLWVAQPL